MQSTIELLETTDFPDLSRSLLTTLQVNLGYLCNQSCVHCHVAAGPHRTEMMSHELIKMIPQVLIARQIKTLDLTGGAPEMHPNFRELVVAARELGVTVIDRCNLTILTEPGYESLASFLSDHQVEVTASLPCYSAENVDKQRGKGVFDLSIRALQMLNELGYGKLETDLVLNLVYNPLGASLPPDQLSLQARYKEELKDHFNIVFNQLFTLTNMPIQRFGAILLAKKQFHDYMQLLKNSYKPDNLNGVMCRSTISVDWQGNLYDCDFNQQLGFNTPDMHIRHLSDLLTIDPQNHTIRIADHCYGCTAGQGSSCGGALNN
jgi:radical SAM/Cys-rich protein